MNDLNVSGSVFADGMLTDARRLYETRMAEEVERSHARSTFLWGMVGGLALTLAGNLAKPLVSESVPLTLVAFALPPLLAGWGAHAALTAHRTAPATALGSKAAKAAVALAALILLVALIASYAHLRDLLLTAQFEPWLASVFALTIDAALLMATIAWFSMRPASDAEMRALRADAEAADRAAEEAIERAKREEARAEREREEAAERERTAQERAERERVEALEHERLREQQAHEAALERARLNAETELERTRLEAQNRARQDAQRVIERSRPSAVATSVDPRLAELAEAVHAAGIARRTPLEKVATVLGMLADGEVNGAIEKASGVHRDTVGKIREWAEDSAEAA